MGRRADAVGDANTAAAAAPFSPPRWMAALAIVAMMATLAAAGLGYVLAQRSDDRLQRERREQVVRSVEDYRALFSDLTLHRAAELAVLNADRAASARGELDARLVPTGNARFLAEQIYLLASDGTLVASYPAGEIIVPARVQQLVDALRADPAAAVTSDVMAAADQP